MRTRHWCLAISLVALFAPGVSAVEAPVKDTPAQAESCGSMEIYAPKPSIQDADPDERHEETRDVATRLNVRFTPDGLLVGVDSLSIRHIRIRVGRNMIVSLRGDVYYYAESDRILFGPRPGQVSTGLPHSPELDHIMALAHEQGFLQFVEELVLFETDIPPQHDWHPERGRYQVLWRGIATGVLNAP